MGIAISDVHNNMTVSSGIWETSITLQTRIIILFYFLKFTLLLFRVFLLSVV